MRVKLPSVAGSAARVSAAAPISVSKGMELALNSRMP